MHNCWVDETESWELYLDLLTKISGKNRYYQATKLVHMINKVHKKIFQERHRFHPCFYPMCVYASLEHGRIDLLRLLLLDKRINYDFSRPSYHGAGNVVMALKEGKLKTHLVEEQASLTFESSYRLYNMVCEE